MKKSILFASLVVLFTPLVAFGASHGEEKEMLHVFAEHAWGPIGAVAGIMAMVIFWRLSRQVEGNFRYMLKMLTLALLCFNIAAVSFGLHGSGIIGEEATIEITSTFRMIGLIIIDISAVVLMSKMMTGKGKEENKE